METARPCESAPNDGSKAGSGRCYVSACSLPSLTRRYPICPVWPSPYCRTPLAAARLHGVTVHAPQLPFLDTLLHLAEVLPRICLRSFLAVPIKRWGSDAYFSQGWKSLSPAACGSCDNRLSMRRLSLGPDFFFSDQNSERQPQTAPAKGTATQMLICRQG